MNITKFSRNFLALMMVLALVGCSNSDETITPKSQPESKEIINTPSETITETIQSQSTPSSSKSPSINDRPSVDIRHKIKASYWKNDDFNACMTDVAENCIMQASLRNPLQASDIAVCDDFLTPGSQTRCRDRIAKDLAQQTGDAKWCDRLSSGKENCQRRITMNTAIKNKDLSICDNYKDPEEKSFCQEDVAQRIIFETGDANYCKYLPKDQQSDCEIIAKDLIDRAEK